MIRGPKNATPTPRGWINPKTGELLKVQRLTDAQIAEWYGVDPVEPIEQPTPALVEEDEWVAEDVDHDGVIDELESMTKKQLEELGREFGVELDRRKSRAALLEQMHEIIDSTEVEEDVDAPSVSGINVPDRAGLIKRLRRGVRKAVTK